MSSSTLVSAAIILFCVAAILYYKNTVREHFTSSPAEVNDFLNAWVSWAPTSPPIAGTSYTPNATPNQKVPGDLNSAPISQPGAYPSGNSNSLAKNQQGQPTNPSLARAIDLMDLDSKITTWLEAATQCERDAPCSLTAQQQGQRLLLQSRLRDIRWQLESNNITDTLRTITREIKELRQENAKWNHMTPFLADVYEFGKGVNQDMFLTNVQYATFLEIITRGIEELENVEYATPQQKVRSRQLHEIRDQLRRSKQQPRIRMGAAKEFLHKMLQPEQPLPTVYTSSQEDAPKGHSDDVVDYLRNIQWNLTLRYDPVGQELQRSATALLNSLNAGDISVTEARNKAIRLDTMLQPAPAGTPGLPLHQQHKHRSGTNERAIIAGASRLCRDVGKAFPRDAAALGCGPIETKYQAETVINTVCNNIRSSVPTVSPDQFNCHALKQQLKRDG